MEALNFLKFWRPTTATTTTATLAGIPSPIIEVEEEEEDSFFDLELAVPDFDHEKQRNHSVKDSATHSLSTSDVFSKRKIIPIEPSSASSKPQSPITLLKSAPKFRVFASKKTHKTEDHAEMSRGSGENNFSSLVLTRENSVNKNGTKLVEDSSISDATSSKRFSKDVIQRYLKLIKPLYVKSSRKNGEKSKLSALDSSMASPSASPATAMVFSPRKEKHGGNAHSVIRVVYKNLGKSKSTSAVVGVESPARRDDSLLQQHDGIQGAILHCKRSFNSSKDSSMLSRSSSDSIKSSSSDCSVLSRYSSDKWIDSARNSSEGSVISM